MGILRRIGDQLVAPGASRGELLVVDAATAALALAVIAVVAFDLFGGSVVNATAAAKRRFHSAIALTAVTVPAALAWFAPVLLIKLLLGHLLPGEAASRGGV